MTYLFKLAARLALVGPLLLAVACSDSQPRDFLSPDPGGPSLYTALKVSPAATTIAMQEPVVLQAMARTASGTEVQIPVSWLATGGSVSDGGVFSATVPGGYQITAIAKSDPNLRASASVTVTDPADELVALAITPESVTVPIGGTATLHAWGTWGAGQQGPVTVSWQGTGGTITPDGVYTASDQPGVYLVIGSTSGLADTTVVTVVPAERILVGLAVSPASVELEIGESATFTVAGQWNDGSVATPDVLWEATGGVILPSGVYTAGSEAGTFRVVARHQVSGLADTSTVVIHAPVPTLLALALTPGSAQLAPGDSLQFAASGSWSDGGSYPIAVSWSATGGTIGPNGLYRAGATPGSYRVIGRSSDGTRADTSGITIAPPAPTVTSMAVSPASATVTTGTNLQFEATGTWSDGVARPIAVTWSVTGGGTITNTGLFTAGQSAGTALVVALCGCGLTDTSTVIVDFLPPPPTLAALVLAPATVSLLPGGTQQFAVTASWSDGSGTVPAVVWSATGGTISASGLYTSGSTPGTFRVVATHTASGRADTSAVTIQPVVQALAVSPASVTLEQGATQQFAVAASWTDGSSVAPVVTWSATGGTITQGGLYAAGTTPGNYRVIAQVAGGTVADTTAVTIVAPTLTAIVLTPQSTTLEPGGIQQFAAQGVWSDGVNRPVSIIWSATGGTVNFNGRYTAGSTPGNYRVIARRQGGTTADTAAVTITPPALTSLTVTPGTATVAAGATQQFAASGTWSNGGSATPPVTWEATGGTVTAGGLYTAGSTSGTYRVIGRHTASGLADTSAVTVTVTPTVVALTVSPATATIQTGTTQQFTATGTWSDGVPRPVTVTWSATGGTISSSGLFTANSTAGTALVIAACACGISDTSVVTKTAPSPPPPVTLTSLAISPKPTSVQTGGTRQFSVSGVWSDGSTTTPSVSYSTNGGSVTSGGLYTAPSTAGTYRVIAAHVGGTLRDTSIVTVTTVTPPPVGTLFSHGFDDGTWGGMIRWGSPQIVTDATANGGRSVRFDWQTSSGDQDQAIEHILSQPQKKIHVRFRYKQDDRANNNGIKKTVRLRGEGTTPIGTFNIQGGKFLFNGDAYSVSPWNIEQPSNTVAAYGPNTFKNQWRYIEIMLDYSTAGRQRVGMWVDGVQIINYDGSVSFPASTTIKHVWLATVYNAPSGTHTEWFDDVVIATSYIGLP